MRRTLLAALAALGIWGIGAVSGRADVVIRVPYFALVVGSPGYHVGPAVRVRVPCLVDVQVSRASRVVTSPRAPGVPGPVVAPDAGAVQPPPPQPVSPAVPAVSIAEFARTFKPAPGTYDVCLIHPRNKCPVKFSFTLPEGSPRKVKVYPRQLVFDYGKHWVKIRFALRGKVRVTSR
jgi:hypothetical protein